MQVFKIELACTYFKHGVTGVQVLAYISVENRPNFSPITNFYT